MNPFTQKLMPEEKASFYAKTHNTPHFEVGWHQHAELELILINKGEGLSYIGNNIGDFKPGDIFFLGSNLPHVFQKRERDLFVSAVVVQFLEDFWGGSFLKLPECNQLRELLFKQSQLGLKISGKTNLKLRLLIHQLESAHDFKRIALLCEGMYTMINGFKDCTPLSNQEVFLLNTKDKYRIDKVLSFTMENFREQIRLEEIASKACMSVPAFCSYFKKCTGKTYIDFLNKIRIGNACKLLTSTNDPIITICYECGFNSISNFHKIFFRSINKTPLQYRKQFDHVNING